MRVTHQFHPWFGEEFDLAFIRHTWGEERVYLTGASGQLCSLPVGFTDVVPPDPFVVVAAGRCPFRLADLVALAELSERLRPPPAQRRVRRITPRSSG